MSLHPDGYVFSLHHLHFVASGLMDICSVSYHGSVLCPIMVPCIHDPPSSHCTATVDPVHRKRIFCINILVLVCLFKSTEWLLSSLSHPVYGLLSLANMSSNSLLKRGVAGLGNLGLLNVVLIYNKDVYIYWY